MSFPRHTHVLHILSLMLVASITPQAGAMQGSGAGSSVPPRGGVVQPTRSAGATQQARPMPESSLALLGRLAGQSSSGDAVLVVPGKPIDQQTIGQIVEDLSIMSRIIQKNALTDDPEAGYGVYRDYVWISGRDALGPPVLFPTPGPKPMYLGGYGALFFIKVNYPLLPPPQTPQEQPAAQQEDPVWAQAKRDVLEPQANVVWSQEAREPAEPYSREKVDTLRDQLTATMKHAANIRALEPGEWITIVVEGPAATPGAGQNPPAAATSRPVATAAIGKTVMTLRATKADVDQYAKGQLNPQQFEQRLQVVTY